MLTPPQRGSRIVGVEGSGEFRMEPGGTVTRVPGPAAGLGTVTRVRPGGLILSLVLPSTAGAATTDEFLGVMAVCATCCK